MNFWVKYVILITTFGIKRFVSEFVSIGDYPDHKNLDLNLPQCGHEIIPHLFEFDINYPKKCFRKEYQNRTYLSYSRMKQILRQNTSERIYRGQPVKYGEQPWTVLIELAGGVCTGSLLTFQWVVTLASCYEGQKKRKNDTLIVVRSGPDRGQWLDIAFSDKSHFHRHPLFIHPPANLFKWTHDIGLIKLDTPFPRHRYYGNRYLINTVCLSKAGQVNTQNEKAFIVGYGSYDNSGADPDFLQIGQIVMPPFRTCPYESLFCTFYPDPKKSRACYYADSGGPLIKQIGSKYKINVLIGLFAGHFPPNATCSSEIQMGAWVAVPNFIDWILKTIKEFS